MPRGTSLADIEKQARREGKLAERWLERHGTHLGNLPGRRLENGESASKQRSSLLTGEFDQQAEPGDGTGGPGHRVRSIVSYDQHDTVDEWEQAVLASGSGYEPLVGRPQQLTKLELERRERLAHVFTFLLPEHVELLLMRHEQGMTLTAMAEELCVTKQAVHARLRVAEQDFRKQYAAHYQDALDG